MNLEAYRSNGRSRTTFLLLILTLGASGAASGCAARRCDELMRSWQGHTLDDLFRTWGPPNYLFSDGTGGQIAVYVPPPLRDIAEHDEPERSNEHAQAERARATPESRPFVIRRDPADQPPDASDR